MTLKNTIASLSDPEKEQFKGLITECLTREEMIDRFSESTKKHIPACLSRKKSCFHSWTE